MAAPGVFRQQIQVFIDKSLSPAAISAKVATIARTERDSLISAGRASMRYATFVDGVEGASEDAVKRNITYQFSSVAGAVDYCLRQLILGSPVGDRPKSGPRYYESFFVAVNGRPMSASSFTPSQCPPDAVCYIYNNQPYGRKVDIQLEGTKPLEFTVPPFLFQRVANQAKREFGKVVSIQRIYSVSIPQQWVTKKGRLVEYPGLQIQPGNI